MKHLIYATLIFSISLFLSTTVKASELSTAFDQILDGMSSDFPGIENNPVLEKVDGWSFYTNDTYDIPGSPESFFTVSETSGKRAFIAGVAAQEKEDVLKALTAVDRLSYNTYYTSAEKYLVAVFSDFGMEGIVSLQADIEGTVAEFTAFDGATFLSTLVQIIHETQANHLKPYAGKWVEGMEQNQRLISLTAYKESYAVYVDVDASNAGYQAYYTNWPTHMFLQLSGENFQWLTNALGNSYQITDSTIDDARAELTLVLEHHGERIMLQFLEHQNTQIVGVGFRK